ALEVNTAIKSQGTFVVTPIGFIDGTGHALLLENLDSVLKLNPDTIIFDLEKTEYPTVAKILLMHRCNIKLHAHFLPGQTRRKEFIVGSVLDCAVEMDQSHMDKGLINHLIENFLQR
ncbi:MAG: hypothetical protein HXY51_14480, partial [Nitrospirae bacterium]|nr:hypothetical protein [Nitrospirota bacterium]